jgi:hypothetical protein
MADERARSDHAAVVVVDFAATRRQDRLHAAIVAAAPRLPVSRVDPVRALATRERLVPLAQLGADVAAAWSTSPRPPIVVGYCSAACLALRVADTLGAPAVLVRPALPAPELVAAEFAECVRALGGTAKPWPTLTGPKLIQWLRAELEDVADAFAVRMLNGDGRISRQLGRHYAGWLSFLLSTADAAATPWSFDGRMSLVGDWTPHPPAWQLPVAARYEPAEPEPADAVTPAVLDAVLRAIEGARRPSLTGPRADVHDSQHGQSDGQPSEARGQFDQGTGRPRQTGERRPDGLQSVAAWQQVAHDRKPPG